MNGKTKFTPGPWRIGNSSPLLFGAVRGNGTEPLGFVYGPNAVESSEVYRRAIADAHLIAATPELYENLANADIQMEMAGDCIEAGRYDEALLHVRSMVRGRRNALAKARGEVCDP